MIEKRIIIGNKTGLHARPAALFVQKANQFKSIISLVKGDRNANAKSILGVMSLGAGQGSVIDIKAEGDDALQAVDALISLVASFRE